MIYTDNRLYNLDLKRYENSLLQEKVASWIGLCVIVLVLVVVLVIVFGLLKGFFQATNTFTVTLISSLIGLAASTIPGVVLFKLIQEFSSRTERIHQTLLEGTNEEPNSPAQPKLAHQPIQNEISPMPSGGQPPLQTT